MKDDQDASTPTRHEAEAERYETPTLSEVGSLRDLLGKSGGVPDDEPFVSQP
ncbi:MAG: hypothetical protein OHK0013_48610 [Sandaracinaceae bacterium]